MATDGPEIARAYVTIMPSMKGVGTAINKEFGGAGAGGAAAFSGGMLAGLKGFAGTLLATIGIGAIKDGFDSIIAEASGLNEANNALNVTYKDTAAQLLAIRENSAELFGLSKLDFSNAAVQMSGFAEAIGGTGGASDAFESIVGRATDFASVMNLEVSDALSLFQSGLAGETEPLRRYGIDLSAAAVEAFAFASGIGDGTGALTEAEKVQARYGLLLQETAVTQGDFANTSNELANKQRIANAQWADARAKLGTEFLPVALKFTEWGIAAIPVVERLADWVGDLFARFDNLKGPVEDTTGVLGFASTMWGELSTLWTTTVAPALADLYKIFNDDVKPVLQDVSAEFNTNLKPAMVDLADFMATYAVPVVKFFFESWANGMAFFLSNVAPTLIKVGGFLGEQIIDRVQTGIELVNLWVEGFNIMKGAVVTVAYAIGSAFKTAFNGIAQAWNKSVGSLSFTIPDIVGVPNRGETFSFPKIPLLAEGGIVTKPTLAMVGEGPESEAVIPLSKLDAMLSGRGGGKGQTIHIHGIQNVDQIAAELPRIQYRGAA
jgi:hypothetical protein